MKKIILLSSFISFLGMGQIADADFTATNIATKLHVPWEITWGPDNKIWFTERSGQGQSTTQPGTNGKVKRVDPETGVVETLLTITDSYESQETGVLGLAIHPDFTTTKPWVYVVYTYQKSGATNGTNTVTNIVEKMVRYTYQNNQLVNPTIILDNIYGNTTHVGSRLHFLSDKTLLMTTGEAQSRSNSQNLSSKSGKILRMNDDGSVPVDNPIANSLVYSFGHRNPQGLVAANGKVYSAEHGDVSNDEVNVIIPNGNYGWPNVWGYCDNLPTKPSNSPSDQPDLTLEKSFCTANNIVEPIWTSGNTSTEATAGLDYYPKDGSVSVLQNSLLLVTLKIGTSLGRDFRVLQLSEDGSSIVKQTVLFNNVFGRIRDICVSPVGDIYIATSNYDGRYSTSGTNPPVTDDRIVKLKYNKTVTGVSDDQKEAIHIYPNPTQGILNVNFQDGEKLTLINVHGAEVAVYTVNNSSINMSELSSGVYLIKNSKNRIVGKVFKI